MDRRSFLTGSIAAAGFTSFLGSSESKGGFQSSRTTTLPEGSVVEFMQKYSMARDILCVDFNPTKSEGTVESVKPLEGNIDKKTTTFTSYIKKSSVNSDSDTEVFVPSFQIASRVSGTSVRPRSEGKLTGRELKVPGNYETFLFEIARTENKEIMAHMDSIVSDKWKMTCSESELDSKVEEGMRIVGDLVEGEPRHTICEWGGGPKVAYVYPPADEFGVIPIFTPPSITSDMEVVFEEIGMAIFQDFIVKITVAS